MKPEPRNSRSITIRIERLEIRALLSVTFSSYNLSSPYSLPSAITSGPGANLWFTEDKSVYVGNNQSQSFGAVGVINATTKTVDEFLTNYPNSSPAGIAVGSDQNIYFADRAGAIGVLNASTHAIVEYPINRANADPYGITSGPDGNIWFTESVAPAAIGMFNVQTHAITEYPLSNAAARPAGITDGPNGNLWFTDSLGYIGEINPTTHSISEYPAGLNAASWPTSDAR